MLRNVGFSFVGLLFFVLLLATQSSAQATPPKSSTSSSTASFKPTPTVTPPRFTPARTTTNPLPETTPACTTTNIDLVFIVDGSAKPPSLSTWNRTTTFIRRVVDYFEIGVNEVHVGIRWYCEGHSNSLELSESNSKQEFNAQLADNYQLFSQANCGFGLATGLNHMIDITFGNPTLRPNASKIAVIVTSNLPYIDQPIRDEISRARAKGIRLIGVGIYGVELEVVNSEALSQLSMNDNLMQATLVCNYDLLNEYSYARQVAQYICVNGSFAARPGFSSATSPVTARPSTPTTQGKVT